MQVQQSSRKWELSEQQALLAAMEGYCVPDDADAEDTQEKNAEAVVFFGDDDKLTTSQRRAMMMLNETEVYPKIKVKRISLSFSGAAVFFFSPIRKDGTPMPSSVLKFDIEDNVRDEVEKTKKYGELFGLTTPKVKATHFLPDVEAQDPSAVMQIDLCGGMFGLPEFASAPPVHTFASVIQSELASSEQKVDVVPIINEALERRMHAFTMSGRSVKKVDLAAMYKIIRFVGHGVLNRAEEGAKRAKKSPALAAGFLNPPDINELDVDGCFVQELCGRRETARDFFQRFVAHESRFSEKFQREVVVGLCHNDLHGGNLLLDSQGLVWLIDFATVKSDVHVLMDLAKFMASCLFLYLEGNAKESNIRMFAKLLATTPDATTALPLVGGSSMKEDKIAAFVLDLLSRLRHCMCIYEVGDDCPSNDGSPFALAMFSWSSRMLSYSEPSVYQKSRALFYSLVCAQRILWEAGVEVGPVAVDWIDEFRQVWEGQKGRRLSTSAAQVQNLTFEFDVEFPRYLAQVGTAEAWSTDFLSREKVHATDHCTAVTVGFSGRIFPRHVSVSHVTKAVLNVMRPINEKYLKEILCQEYFYGRLVLIGNSGTGKTILTKQLFSEISQQQLIGMCGSPDLHARQQTPPSDLRTKIIPVRVPLVDFGRQLESDPDTSLDADLVGDLLTQWVQNRYGQDSVPHKLLLDVRSANLSITKRRSSLMSSDSLEKSHPGATPVAGDLASVEITETQELMGLLLLLDGYDEASANRHSVLQYIKSLLLSEPGHVTILSSRPGSIGKEEAKELSGLGFGSFAMTALSSQEAVAIARSTLSRLNDPETLIDGVVKDILLPAYASLRAVPLVLTLLVHVLRKYIQMADGVASASKDTKAAEVLKKTEIYQRAVRLILHQSDAAKFALREGRSDQDMVQRLEMLKSPRARKLFQAISWYSHCKKSRSFNWDEVSGISTDTEALSTIRQAFQHGRLPILQKLEDEDSDMVQFSHLSFQELLAGEYASAIMQYGHSNSSASAYVNYFVSNSARSLERDRLSEQWWLQVWMHVCEMLSPSALQEWLSILAQDEQAKLKEGRLVPLIALTPPGLKTTLAVTEIQWDEGWLRMKEHYTGCEFMRRFNLYLPDSNEIEFRRRKKEHVEVSWPHNGVAAVMRTAVDSCQTPVVKALVELKVHYTLHGEGQPGAYSLALASPDESTFQTFTDAGVLYSYYCQFGEENVGLLMTNAGIAGKRIDRMVDITRGRQELRRMPKCWLLEQVRLGTLELGPDVDPNFTDPATQLTPLMVAAGFGHVELVKGLLSIRASVNTMSAERCTALTFAAECKACGTADCLKLLIEAGADIHHIAGHPLTGTTWEYIKWQRIGFPSRAGKAVCRCADDEKLSILLGAGYDINLQCGSTHIFNEAVSSGDLGMVKRLVELRVDPHKVPPRENHLLQNPVQWLTDGGPEVLLNLSTANHATVFWKESGTALESFEVWKYLVDLKVSPKGDIVRRLRLYPSMLVLGNMPMVKFKQDFRAVDALFNDWDYAAYLEETLEPPLAGIPRGITLSAASDPGFLLRVFDKYDVTKPLTDRRLHRTVRGQSVLVWARLLNKKDFLETYADWVNIQEAKKA